MREVMIENKIEEHDKHLDALTRTIENLSSVTTQTNIKLEKVVDALNTQNVLIERMNNMDSNLKDTFKRVHARLENNEEIIKNVPASATIRWAIGIIVTYLAISGNYIVAHIHTLETKVFAHEQAYQSNKKATEKHFDILEGMIE